MTLLKVARRRKVRCVVASIDQLSVRQPNAPSPPQHNIILYLSLMLEAAITPLAANFLYDPKYIFSSLMKKK